MALQKTLLLDNGLTIQDAYLKINEITGNKTELKIALDVFVSKETSDANKPFVVRKHYQYAGLDLSENAQRWDKQAYKHLKTLNEYEDAIDV